MFRRTPSAIHPNGVAQAQLHTVENVVEVMSSIRGPPLDDQKLSTVFAINIGSVSQDCLKT